MLANLVVATKLTAVHQNVADGFLGLHHIDQIMRMLVARAPSVGANICIQSAKAWRM